MQAFPNRDVKDISHYLLALSKADALYLNGLVNVERPSIVERIRKMNEEMFFSHRKTGALVSYEEAEADTRGGYDHPSDYVRLCRDYKLGKPSSVENAKERYDAHFAVELATYAAPKKKSKKPTFNLDWSNAAGGVTLTPAPVLYYDELLLNEGI